jgi:hypothetical protein
MRRRFENANRQSLLELIGDLIDLECEDPRDKIYGLLGLLPFEERPPLLVADYQKSTKQLLRDLVNYATDRPGNYVWIMEQLSEIFGVKLPKR